MFKGKDKRVAWQIASRHSRTYLDRTGLRVVNSHNECYNSAMDMAIEKNKEAAEKRVELLGAVSEWLSENVENYSECSFHTGGFLKAFEQASKDF